jgi:hypothetical protein
MQDCDSQRDLKFSFPQYDRLKLIRRFRAFGLFKENLLAMKFLKERYCNKVNKQLYKQIRIIFPRILFTLKLTQFKRLMFRTRVCNKMNIIVTVQCAEG